MKATKKKGPKNNKCWLTPARSLQEIGGEGLQAVQHKTKQSAMNNVKSIDPILPDKKHRKASATSNKIKHLLFILFTFHLNAI